MIIQNPITDTLTSNDVRFRFDIGTTSTKVKATTYTDKAMYLPGGEIHKKWIKNSCTNIKVHMHKRVRPGLKLDTV